MNRVIYFIFPISVLGFVAVGVQYWNIFFNTNTRWLFIFGLFLTLFASEKIYSGLRSRFGQVLIIYIAWGMASTGWSELPLLSLMKSIAFFLTATVLFGGGYVWSANLKQQNVLDYLWPIFGLTLFSGFFASASGSEFGLHTGSSIVIYQGLTGNPNYLGAMVAMSFPLALWLVHRYRDKRVWSFVFGATNVALLYLLWKSGSRSALLVVAFIGLFFLITSRAKMLTTIIILAGIVLLAVSILVPKIQESAYERLVIKGSIDEDGAILFSRQEIWSESYLQALKGGFIGGGYGVTIGDADRAGGITLASAVNYGREKGNTQLAVWEETGLIGLGLYGWLVILLVSDLCRAILRTKDPDKKIELGLISGAIIGFIGHSAFEAWWVAPGAPESAYFWAMVGVASGLIRRSASLRQRSQYLDPSAITASSIVAPLSRGS